MTDTSAAKRTLARDIVLYTAFRLGLVVAVFAALYGIGLLFLDEVPPVPVFLFALVISLPLSMVLGKKLRTRVNESAAVIDAARRDKRDDFRRRLQGADE